MGSKPNPSLIRRGFFQAAGVVVYCSLVGTMILNGDKLFGRMANLVGPISFLLLFSVSALICALIVFYQPYILFFDNKKKEAVDLVIFTTGWLFLFLLVFLLFAVFL